MDGGTPDGGGGDTDDGTENEASVYLTPELTERHFIYKERPSRRLRKQGRLRGGDLRGPGGGSGYFIAGVLGMDSSRSISTDDDECYFSSAEYQPLAW